MAQLRICGTCSQRDFAPHDRDGGSAPRLRLHLLRTERLLLSPAGNREFGLALLDGVERVALDIQADEGTAGDLEPPPSTFCRAGPRRPARTPIRRARPAYYRLEAGVERYRAGKRARSR